ncbi:antifungal protein [Ustulina deusta]|nr:antifungal protein [Ustulina deusta]
MQIATAALFLFAAVGAVATPVESNPNSVDVRDGAGILITYTGTCTKVKNECTYKGENGKDTFVKCPSKKKCTKDGAKCAYDSVTKDVMCE